MLIAQSIVGARYFAEINYNNIESIALILILSFSVKGTIVNQSSAALEKTARIFHSRADPRDRAFACLCSIRQRPGPGRNHGEAGRFWRSVQYSGVSSQPELAACR